MAIRAPLEKIGKAKYNIQKGVALKNEVTNGDFSDGTTGWAASASANTVVSGNLLNTGDGLGANPFFKSSIEITPISPTKIYTYAKTRITDANCQTMKLFTRYSNTGEATLIAGVAIVNTPTINQWYEFSNIYEFKDTDTYWGNVPLIVLGQHIYADAATANGKVMEVDGIAGVFAINMTALGIEAWSESQMLTAVQDGYFENYKIFPSNYITDPISILLPITYEAIKLNEDAGTAFFDISDETDVVATPVKIDHLRNGIEMENEVTNGDFADGTTGWSVTGDAVLSASNNILRITLTTTNYDYASESFSAIIGDKIFAYVRGIVGTVNWRFAVYSPTAGAIINSLSQSSDGEYYAIDTVIEDGSHTVRLYADGVLNGGYAEFDGTAGVFAINMTGTEFEDYTEGQMLSLVRQGYFDGTKQFLPNEQYLIFTYNEDGSFKNVAGYSEPTLLGNTEVLKLSNTSTSDYITIGYSYDFQSFYKEIDSVKEYSIPIVKNPNNYYLVAVKNTNVIVMEFTPTDLVNPSQTLIF